MTTLRLPEPLARSTSEALAEAIGARPTTQRTAGPVALQPTRVALARGRLASAAAAAGVAGFLGIFALVKANRTEAIDLAITLRIQGRRHRVVDRAMAAGSWPGFPPQSRIIPPVISLVLAAGGLRLESVFQALAWASALLSTAVKAIMRRPRPLAGTDLRVVAAPLGGSSFPSGHTITYVGTYGFLAYLAHTLVRPAGLRRALVGWLLGLIAVVGPSRIQQGHHWPTDVTASYLLGTSYVIGLTSVYRRLKARQSAAHV